jgi:peptidylprolyl isomerase
LSGPSIPHQILNIIVYVIMQRMQLPVSQPSCTGPRRDARDTHSQSIGRRQLLTAPLLLAPAVSLLALPQPASAESLLTRFAKGKTWTKTTSGIGYYDREVGKGEAPLPGDGININIVSRAVINDRIFYSNRGFAFIVGESGLTKGFDLAILGDGKDLPPLLLGGKRAVVIPPELAYGAQGAQCYMVSGKRRGT